MDDSDRFFTFLLFSSQIRPFLISLVNQKDTLTDAQGPSQMYKCAYDQSLVDKPETRCWHYRAFQRSRDHPGWGVPRYTPGTHEGCLSLAQRIFQILKKRGNCTYDRDAVDKSRYNYSRQQTAVRQ